jgi:hypothetical protein
MVRWERNAWVCGPNGMRGLWTLWDEGYGRIGRCIGLIVLLR